MKVTFWGSFSEVTPQDWQCPPVKDLAAFREMLFSQFPALSERRCLIAVNKVVMRENSPLNEGDEIAVMPPFAGG